MSEPREYMAILRQSTGMRFVVLFTAFFFLLVLASGIAAILSEIKGLETRDVVLLSSVAQCLLAFCGSAWLAARFSSDCPWRFLGVSEKISPRAFIGVVVVYLLALPAMNQLIDWNANIHFPDWASGIEATLRGWEDANGEVAQKALMAHTFWEMLAGVAVVGLMTGFSEELFFRGAMQNMFRCSGMMPGMAVWASALIFSAVHFQFFGFFPRLLMGVFFGYLLVWTGSIWPAVFAHALNNSIVVVASWENIGLDASDIEKLGVSGNGTLSWLTIMSVVSTVLFFVCFRKTFFHGGAPVKS